MVPSSLGDVVVELGRRIAAIRRLRKLSQEMLAERSSITVSYLSRIEIGRRRPTLEVLIAIADALEVPLWRLLADQRLTSEELGWKDRAGVLGKAIVGLGDADLDILITMAHRMRFGSRPTRLAEGTGDPLPDAATRKVSRRTATKLEQFVAPTTGARSRAGTKRPRRK